MNILYITNHLNIGGITHYVLTLAKGLKKRGHKVYVASSVGVLLPKFLEERITYIPIPIKTKSEVSYKILLSYFKLKRYIKENQIEIIHAHSRTTQVLAHFLSEAMHIPYVSTCHGFFKQRFSRRVFPCWGKKVIAISESVKRHLIDDFYVDEEKIRIVHNGVGVEKAIRTTDDGRRTTKTLFNLHDGPVVGIIARLSEEKGHIYLIQAMRYVVDRIPQAQLLIVGDGRLKEKLVNLTKELGLEKNVIFFPSVINIEELFSVMDIFVLPSLKEGLGLSLMEAMASGLAVIGSDIGGIKDLIQDDFNGLLVRPADIDALGSAILELLDNPTKREFLGRNAQVFIKENFSQEKMVLNTEEVYLECLSAKD